MNPTREPDARLWPLYKPLVYAFGLYAILDCAWAAAMFVAAPCGMWSRTMLWPHIAFAIAFAAAAGWRGRSLGAEGVLTSAAMALIGVGSTFAVHVLLFTWTCD